MHYTINDVTHYGFQPVTHPIRKGTKVVAVWFEGSYELWMVESPEALDRLKAMKIAEWTYNDKSTGALVGQERTTFDVMIAV